MIAKRASVLLVLSAALVAGGILRADTVLFDAANLGPAGSLQLGGIAVSDLYGVNQPRAIAGYGVGDVAGPAGSFIVSGNNPDSGLHLSVNGLFNSITVLPFAVDQNGTPVALNFALSYQLYSASGGTAASGFPIRNIFLTGSAGPSTFADPTILIFGTQFYGIDLTANDASEASYLAAHPGITSLTFGYVVEAADVTAVPDQASTWTLLGLSTGAMFLFHRLRRPSV